MSAARELDRAPVKGTFLQSVERSTPAFRRFTAAEDRLLLECLDAHRTYHQMAALMPGREPSSLRRRANLLGLGRYQVGYTVESLAETMGVCHMTIRRWVLQYRLPCRRTPWRDGRHVTTVDHDDLVEWLEREPCWHLWEPERITDLALREWAMELRRGVHYLTTRQAGHLLGYSPGWVYGAIRTGRLRGVQTGNGCARWLVRSDWVDEFKQGRG